MVFTDLSLSQEFKTLGMDDYLWVQACQGFSLWLTGTSGLVEEGGVLRVFEAFRG